MVENGDDQKEKRKRRSIQQGSLIDQTLQVHVEQSGKVTVFYHRLGLSTKLGGALQTSQLLSLARELGLRGLIRHNILAPSCLT